MLYILNGSVRSMELLFYFTLHFNEFIFRFIFAWLICIDWFSEQIIMSVFIATGQVCETQHNHKLPFHLDWAKIELFLRPELLPSSLNFFFSKNKSLHLNVERGHFIEQTIVHTVTSELFSSTFNNKTFETLNFVAIAAASVAKER